ncbi:MAG: hypothetical protein IKP96_01665 [Elusimicrobiaceae bacterium]|nr:hypothetical protein [Elusimicrobiaceae bacterium]
MSITKSTPCTIHPEVLDENGRVICAKTPQDHARPQGDTGGLLSGLLVLTVGFLTTIAVILFGLVVVCPLLLLGRLFGFQVRFWKS